MVIECVFEKAGLLCTGKEMHLQGRRVDQDMLPLKSSMHINRIYIYIYTIYNLYDIYYVSNLASVCFNIIIFTIIY